MASMIRTRSTAPSARIERALSFVRRSATILPTPSSSLGALAIAGLAAAASAQMPIDVSEGMNAEIAFSTAASFDVGGAQLGPTDGSYWIAIRNRLELHDGLGNAQIVVNLPLGASTSLIQRAGSPERLYWGDFSTDTIVVVDPTSQTQVDTLTAPAFAFSLDVTPGGDILVAAANSSFTATEILRLESGQAPQLLGSFPNASGPLLIDQTSGDLFYAVQAAAFPPPPGAVTIQRLPAATLQNAIDNGTQFSIADSTTFASGLDGAFDMVFDDRGRILVSDPNSGVVRAVNANGSVGEIIAPDNTPEASLSLDFRDTGVGTFDPFQADDGSELLVQTTWFGAFATVQFLDPVQPVLDATNGTTIQSGVDYGLVCTGLPQNGAAFFTIGFQTQPGMVPQLFATAPTGAPILSVLDFSSLPPITLPAMVDATGSVTLSAPNLTSVPILITVEVFAVDPTLTTVAVSTPQTLLLQN